jgi:crossover junction endodeoxyribonuclease RuvC
MAVGVQNDAIVCYNIFMKILGIDPGMAIVGYCVLDGGKISVVTSGSIRTSKDKSEPARLLEIFEDLCTIIEKYRPDAASVERLFYFKNQKTIIPVAQARGVILAALEKYSIPVFEYTPMEVKQVITGYGKADKKEVAVMVGHALGGAGLPKLDDTVDAIAIAICHVRNNY